MVAAAEYEAINWEAYATQYDLLARINPSYRENIEIVTKIIEGLSLSASPSICDLGGGTGNYTCELFRHLPTAQFTHVDADARMNRIAARKFEDLGVLSARVVTNSVFEADLPEQSFDLVLCVNALYAMSPQSRVLQRVRRWLKPGGYFLVIDFGRRTKVLDWGRYILGSMLRERGIRESVKIVLNSLESLSQNRRGSKGQADGTYWLHSTEEFGETLADAGFLVEDLRTCYRGYCDLAVCQAPIPVDFTAPAPKP